MQILQAFSDFGRSGAAESESRTFEDALPLPKRDLYSKVMISAGKATKSTFPNVVSDQAGSASLPIHGLEKFGRWMSTVVLSPWHRST